MEARCKRQGLSAWISIIEERRARGLEVQGGTTKKGKSLVGGKVFSLLSRERTYRAKRKGERPDKKLEDGGGNRSRGNPTEAVELVEWSVRHLA